MRKRIIYLLAWYAVASLNIANAQTSWKPVKGTLTTPWTNKVNPYKALPEYPRPQMVREGWQNLNGLWNYAISPILEDKPSEWQGKILVPFAIESDLSGVKKAVGPEEILWYQRTFTAPDLANKRLLLHFGAVDWKTTVWINGKKVGTHQGGYDAFSFDITSAIQKGQQQILVKVWDPTDKGFQPIGKQTLNPRGIWYTSTTGIWQTVWLEAVPQNAIEHLKITPDIDAKTASVIVSATNGATGYSVRATAFDHGKKVSETKGALNEPLTLQLNNMKLWSPDDPFLYDLTVSLYRNGQKVDEVKSYFGMRKISLEKDEKGVPRLFLNNKALFQFGPLDQGFWPDGIYTAPTDDALKFDIQSTKNWGFNMIRKHVKVEPQRWYYWCDKIGMLVWQDMPSGDLGGNSWDSRPGQMTGRKMEKDRTAESEAIYKTEWNAIIKALHPFPCIVVWVPFNEAWGQFKTKEITEWTKKLDPSRLVNAASGGNFLENVGDILDLHNYPDPQMPTPYLFGKKQVVVLGEFGGLGLPLEEHTWQDKNNWGYQTFKNQQELETRYARLMNDLSALIPLGLSAAVYTQTTDVEIETNGLMTYDRKVFKIDPKRLKELHQKLYQHSVK